MTLLKTNNCTKTASMKREDHTYNGWANYPTWAVGVYDFFDYDDLKERLIPEAIIDAKAKDYLTQSFPDKVEFTLSDIMKDEFDNWLEEIENIDNLSPLLQDFIRYAKDDVDWRGIASHYDEEIKEVIEETE